MTSARFRPVALLLAIAMAVPHGAEAWRARNWHEVFPLGNGVWEVLAEPGSGPADFWCGAGDYATVQLGARAVQRIYVWRGVGPSVTRPRHRAVQFAFEPPEGADTSTGITLDIRRAGDNLTTAAARQYCYGGKFSDEEIWRPGW